MKPGRAVALATLGALCLSVAPATSAAAARHRHVIDFRPVLSMVPPEGATPSTTSPVDLVTARATVESCDANAVAQLAVVPTTTAKSVEPGGCVVFPFRPGGSRADRYYLGPAKEFGIDDAKAEFVAGQGWTVKIELTKSGAKAWDRLAKEQFHKQVAITVDSLVESAPTIQPNDARFTSFGGSAVISGGFTQKEAVRLTVIARLANGR